MAHPIERKVALIPRRQGLTTHSALSMVKKAAAGIQETSTPYHKMLYMEKSLVQSLDKYILAKVEAADAWTSLMEQEVNPAIRGLYLCLSELDRIWVILQQRYRLQLPEQRKLFKQLLQGEEEIAKLRKQAAATATKVAKLQRQSAEAIAKVQANKGDRKKLESLKNELTAAVWEDRRAQKQHGLGLDNHRKYKHNEVRKLMKNLSDVELQLHKDCCKVSEVKAQICEMYMKEPLSKQDEASIHRVSEVCRDLISSLCKDLGIATAKGNTQERQLRPKTSQLPPKPTNQITGRPQAPPPGYDSLMSATSNKDKDFYLDVCYTPIPENDSDDDECEADYIYSYGGNVFKSCSDAAAAADDDDDDDEDYEYVPPDLEEDTSGEPPEYLDIIDGSTGDQKPSAGYRHPITSQSSVSSEDEIFGTISSLNIKPRRRDVRPTSGSRLPSEQTGPEGYSCLWQSHTKRDDTGSPSGTASSHSSYRSSSGTGSAWSSVTGSSVSSSDSDRRPPLYPRKKINK